MCIGPVRKRGTKEASRMDTYTGHYTVSYDDGDTVTHENFVQGLQWKLVANPKTKRDSRKLFRRKNIFV